MARADRASIEALMLAVPAAPPTWVDVFEAAGMSIACITSVLETMSADPDSPLREAEQGVLSKEMIGMQKAVGMICDDDAAVGRGSIVIRLALTMTEKNALYRVVNHLLTPVVRPAKKFGHSGHNVARAARHCTLTYTYSRIPVGSAVAEVGANEVAWAVNPSRPETYVGTVPRLGPRDVVRHSYGVLKKVANGSVDPSVDSVQKYIRGDTADSGRFVNVKIQDLHGKFEYIVSNDANYDVTFGDMPKIMAGLGARVWMGVMLRAKGLSGVTRAVAGEVPHMGAMYKVNWGTGLIDFHFKACSGFGYSHNVYEYCKYEERNGYVWYGRDADYVYCKGPETNDSLLFFNVMRVTKALRMVMPSFVGTGLAGMVEVDTVWAVGGEIDGVPRRFERVTIVVEELAFAKIYEKRRSLDVKGNVMMTLALVRSTSVRYWINGMPVGAVKKVEQACSAGLAVAIEVLVSDSRRAIERVFDKANEVFFDCVKEQPLWLRMLSNVFDVRSVCGSVMSTMSAAWDSVRVPLADAAVSALGTVRVAVRKVEEHVGVPLAIGSAPDMVLFGGCSGCVCLEVANVRSLAHGGEVTFAECERYISRIMPDGVCRSCIDAYDHALLALGEAVIAAEVAEEVAEDSVVSDAGSVVSEESAVVTVASTMSSVWDSDGDVEEIPRDLSFESMGYPGACMLEYEGLAQFLLRALLSEVAKDVGMITSYGYDTTAALCAFSTTRTKHYVLDVLGGRVVASRGPEFESIGAAYCVATGSLHKVVKDGNAFRVVAGRDGTYYSCNKLKVVNHTELAAAVRVALEDGNPDVAAVVPKCVLGVPGAGKTFRAAREVADLYHAGKWPVLMLAVTNASVDAAKGYAVGFGVPAEEVGKHFMTLHRYLLFSKGKYKVVYIDEFPMAHMGEMWAAIALSYSRVVRCFGDGEQIEYDSFQKEFPAVLSNFRPAELPSSALTTMDESHRLSRDVCAMWLDRYKAIYPCRCCNDKRASPGRATFEVRRVSSAAEIEFRPDARKMTFSQDEKEVVYGMCPFNCSVEKARKMRIGGLATVNEDQGSTHDEVDLVRVNDVYDKKQSSRNPSLYNRRPFCVTASTRQRRSAIYWTTCEEDDLLVKRVGFCKDERRLALVDARQGMTSLSAV